MDFAIHCKGDLGRRMAVLREYWNKHLCSSLRLLKVAASGKLPPLRLPVEMRKCRLSRTAARSKSLMNIQKLLRTQMLYTCKGLLNYHLFLKGFNRIIFGSLLKESLLKYCLIWTLQIMALSGEEKSQSRQCVETQGFCGWWKVGEEKGSLVGGTCVLEGMAFGDCRVSVSKILES